MLTAEARGVYLIAATPFAADGSLDLEGLDRLIDWYLGHGVDGLTLLGQLGEAPKLTTAESLDVARRVLGRVRVPVVVGVSSPGFAGMMELTAAVMDAGAAGVMVAPPGSLRGDEAVLGYCRETGALLGDVPWPQAPRLRHRRRMLRTAVRVHVRRGRQRGRHGHAEERRQPADRPDELPVPGRRGDRLHGRARGCPVRDQEPERLFHLRLRIFVLRLSRDRFPGKKGASAPFSFQAG